MAFLAREFRRAVVFAAAVVMLGGLALRAGIGPGTLSYGKACYAVFCMMFFQPGVVDFPAQWYLQPLFYVLPIAGLGALADSFVRLGYLVFTQKQKLPEWQRMKAQALSEHTVVCGVGKVGYRVIGELVAAGEPVVAIERDAGGELVAEVIALGVPVLFGNARHKPTLAEANVARARVLIAATDDDLANLDAALTARELNPAVRVVLRMFDDTLATKVGAGFGMTVISTSQCAAPAFVAAALGGGARYAFELGGTRLHFADLVVARGSPLIGHAIDALERDAGVRVVLRAEVGAAPVAPSADARLAAGDALALVAMPHQLAALEARNRGR